MEAALPLDGKAEGKRANKQDQKRTPMANQVTIR